MKKIYCLVAGLLSMAAMAPAQCGIPPIKPIPPIGCKDTRPVCICTADGTCRWEFICVPTKGNYILESLSGEKELK